MEGWESVMDTASGSKGRIPHRVSRIYSRTRVRAGTGIPLVGATCHESQAKDHKQGRWEKEEAEKVLETDTQVWGATATFRGRGVTV